MLTVSTTKNRSGTDPDRKTTHKFKNSNPDYTHTQVKFTRLNDAQSRMRMACDGLFHTVHTYHTIPYVRERRGVSM